MNPFASCSGFFRQLRHDRRGNVLMLMGFSVIPLTFATGMVIDYSRAARLQTKLNAIADSAALSAVTAPEMQVTDDTTVHDEAVTMFNAQASALSGLDGTPAVNVVLTHPDGASSRNVQVSYTANSYNAFGGVLHMRSIAIGGSSTAKASAPPNIDFYLALDTSPSMAIPTTTDDIAKMDSIFSCSFACHSNKIEVNATGAGSSMPNGLILNNSTYAINISNNGISTKTFGSGKNAATYRIEKIDSNGTYIYVDKDAPVTTTLASQSSTIRNYCSKNASGKDLCVYNSDGSFVDSYWYALNKNISLRVTAEKSAVGDLMNLAETYAQTNKRQYRAALYTFDYGQPANNNNNYNNIKTISSLTTDLDSITASANGINLVTVNDRVANGCPPAAKTACAGAATYLFTSFKSILDKMTTDLPNPSGHGTDQPGDTPQAYLFIVTDGMSDEDIGSGRTRAAMQQAQINQCNLIKASPTTTKGGRGVRIAIVYTEYTVASIQDDQASDPSQFTQVSNAITKSPTVADQLTACASPGLMYTVHTNESISSALQTLFSKALSTARLIQ
jgi:Flp pilus assembly protein TadG